jgi:hypothetical protein
VLKVLNPPQNPTSNNGFIQSASDLFTIITKTASKAQASKLAIRVPKGKDVETTRSDILETANLAILPNPPPRNIYK